MRMIYVAKISIEVIDIINVRKFMIRLKTNVFSPEFHSFIARL